MRSGTTQAQPAASHTPITAEPSGTITARMMRPLSETGPSRIITARAATDRRCAERLGLMTFERAPRSGEAALQADKVFGVRPEARHQLLNGRMLTGLAAPPHPEESSR